MKKLSIVGYYESETTVSGGQGVKTAILTNELESRLGKENISRISTCEWRSHIFTLIWQCVKASLTSENILFLTDANGVKVFPKLFNLLNRFKHYKTHYYVVGGWLTEYLDKNPKMEKPLKKLSAIYVEIPSMKKDLEQKGFSNIVMVNKFRRMTIANPDELEYAPKPPYRICFFSRVMKEKGIEDAIAAVQKANEFAGFLKYELDIYGAVDPGYKDIFETMQANLPDGIMYKGIVDFRKSTETLQHYFAMLFPTFYPSEGYPNTFVDSFAAGLPIIASRWNYNAELLRDGEDGYLVDVGDVEGIVEVMERLASDQTVYANMRRTCLERCTEYLPEKAIEKVIQNLK